MQYLGCHGIAFDQKRQVTTEKGIDWKDDSKLDQIA